MSGALAICVIASVGLVAVGVPLALGRIGPNPFFGVRTAATLANRKLWDVANRGFGRGLIVLGLAALAITGGMVAGGAGEGTTVLAWAATVSGGVVALVGRSLVTIRRWRDAEGGGAGQLGGEPAGAMQERHAVEGRLAAFRTMERVLDAMSVLGWAGSVGYLWWRWASIPARIPIHFDGAGSPDRWGDKAALMGLVGVPLVLGLLLLGLRHLVARGSYPEALPPERLATVHATARLMLAGVTAATTLLFAALLTSTIQVALGTKQALPGWLLPAFLTAVFGVLFWGVIRIRAELTTRRQ